MGKKTKIWVLTAVLVIAAATAFAFADTAFPADDDADAEDIDHAAQVGAVGGEH